MSVALCGAFFCSGAAALLFETLWFRLTGLGLGNSVWASSLVLTAFMAGLALGNAAGARYGGRVGRPLRAFAALEAAVALLSLALVLALPAIGAWAGPLLAGLQPRPWLLNGLRAAIAFALMLLPATAMGATLPVLARALAPLCVRFGVALGRLYGWNTLGGVAGALASETLLVPRLGLARTALVAASLNLVAVAVALALDRRSAPLAAETGGTAAAGPSTVFGARLARLLAAAALAGATLLALEVVWFRFLELFVFGTQLAFALMLAVVLAGIGLGGLLGAVWLGVRTEAARALVPVALLAGIAAIATYAAFDPARAPAGGEATRALWLSLALMLPTSLVSGVLFTLIGTAARDELPGDAAAAGALTLANTLGASLGAPLAGLGLLPWLGIERSLLALALAYAVVALVLLPRSRALPRLALAGAAGAFALVALLFPFGLMQGRFVARLARSLGGDGARVVALREGQAHTAILLQTDWGGAPFYQQLVTNAHSMSSSLFYARRYMKLFAYWPLAVRPGARRALLVSYGMGNTAEALVLSRGLERIDVVDTSRVVLELSPRAERAGAGDPLQDPRVRVHVEDGRFFLRAAGEPYDIITAEPPPPQGAGVASLYSLEYFRLTRARLVPGGVATHWLPVNQLPLAAARSIVRAFCDVFPDCSLWSGAGYDWILAGTNGAAAPAEADFTRLWDDPGTGADLRDLGIERPEQLGALFIADAGQLAEWTADHPPLVDDRPGWLAPGAPGPEAAADYQALQEPEACAARFRSSVVLGRIWPAGLRERTAAWFAWQGVFNRDYEAAARPQALAELWAVLEATPLRTLPLLQLDSEPRIRETARQRHLEGGVHPALAFHLGAAALAGRDHEAAARFFAAAREEGHAFHSPRLMRALALGLAGRRDLALAAVAAVAAADLPPHSRPWREWLAERLARGPLPPPSPARPPA
jgi:predicted membrane-bound spermidine synthase